MNWRWNGLLLAWLGAILAVSAGSGCRTTVRVTDTSQTATQQLLLTSTVDSVVAAIDFHPLAGNRVYLNTANWGGESSGYIAYRIRESMLTCGVLLADTAEEADLIVDVGLAVHGTDSENSILGVSGATQLPEANLCIRDLQYGVSKLAMFAYDRQSGTLVWQSGSFRADGYHRQQRVLGLAPMRSGTIEHSADRLRHLRPEGWRFW